MSSVMWLPILHNLFLPLLFHHRCKTFRPTLLPTYYSCCNCCSLLAFNCSYLYVASNHKSGRKAALKNSLLRLRQLNKCSASVHTFSTFHSTFWFHWTFSTGFDFRYTPLNNVEHHKTRCSNALNISLNNMFSDVLWSVESVWTGLYTWDPNYYGCGSNLNTWFFIRNLDRHLALEGH